MLKRFVVVAVAAAGFFFGVMHLFLEGVYSTRNVLDAAFFTGMTTFILGLLLQSQAMHLFRGIGYTFKRMFSKKEQRKTYYEYLSGKEEKDRAVPIGGPLLIVGGILLAASIALSYWYLNQ